MMFQRACQKIVVLQAGELFCDLEEAAKLITCDCNITASRKK